MSFTVSERPVPSSDSTHFGILRRFAVKDGYVVAIVTHRTEKQSPPFGGSALVYECSAHHVANCEHVRRVMELFPERPEPSTKPAA